jgi:uracil-DNA glycosylase family protein
MAERRRGKVGVPIVPTGELVPKRASLQALARAARDCRGCPLHARATQTVFGEGPRNAGIVIVGEQPGEVEDKVGRPFVGPAGAMLDRALAQAGLERRTMYVTNAVKHFNFEESRGKARLHKKPRPGDVRACRPWLEAEIRVIRPRALVLLGATAVLSLFGPHFRLTEQRGQILTTPWAEVTVASWHPSMVLRAPDSAARARLLSELARDLAEVKGRIRG